VLTGSHLDSVPDGGAYDGPLGVVSALAAVDLLRDRGFGPGRRLGIGVFVEEEGSRFGLACLGSRLATGATTWDRARVLQDRAGTPLEEAMADVPRGEADLLDGVGCFVELHVEQGRDLVDRDVPVGVASAIWPHGRYRFEFTGQANHAGTTRMEDRRDPMLTYAATALAANQQARASGRRATFGRLDVHPNGTNAVPSRVTAWLDARARTSDELEAMLVEVAEQARQRAAADGTALTVTAESVSPAVHFDGALARRIAGPGDWPVIPTMAGHDAGVLSAAGVPTAMLFVRNPTGVSHAPDEHAETVDCLAGVEALADTLQRLCT
jgi:N-carbamoyl-L-amino-acid hydrolase